MHSITNDRNTRNMTAYEAGYVLFLNGADFCNLPEVAELEMGWLAAESAMQSVMDEKDDLMVGDGLAAMWIELDECGFGEEPIYGDVYHE